MSPEYPYQIVTFIDSNPAIGEGVYQGENGWYPQLTLKRRFTDDGATDKTIIALVEGYFKHQSPLQVQIGTLTQTARMPVRVLPILNSEDLIMKHLNLITYKGEGMKSRYPERDGENYYPHITAEYDGKNVIDVNRYENRTLIMARVCIIKDAEDGDSYVLSYIELMKALV